MERGDVDRTGQADVAIARAQTPIETFGPDRVPAGQRRAAVREDGWTLMLALIRSSLARC